MGGEGRFDAGTVVDGRGSELLVSVIKIVFARMLGWRYYSGIFGGQSFHYF